MASGTASHSKATIDGSERNVPQSKAPPPPYEPHTSGIPSYSKANGDDKGVISSDVKAPDHESEEPPKPDDAEYHDRYITCTPSTLTIRWYYFPGGSKKIALTSIHGISRVPLNLTTSGARIWGTFSPTVWAHLDPSRPSKSEAILIDLGSGVRPLITPQDVSALVSVLERHGQIPVHTETDEPLASG